MCTKKNDRALQSESAEFFKYIPQKGSFEKKSSLTILISFPGFTSINFSYLLVSYQHLKPSLAFLSILYFLRLNLYVFLHDNKKWLKSLIVATSN
jgi:hypothetical protein